MFCTKCGTQNEISSAFCISCGTKLVAPVWEAQPNEKAPRPWFKKKRFIVPIALMLLISVSSIANGGYNGPVNTTEPKGTESSQAADELPSKGTESSSTSEDVPGIGNPAVDGKFSFTVTAVKCGISSVGSDFAEQTPQGQFCRVSLTIENVGREPQTMFADNQKLFDSEGREFSPDTSAMIFMDDYEEMWLEEINPGNALKGNLLFDLPKDATPAILELHDSMFSSGVTVSLK